MILPKRLKKGDTIGVIAPSGHLREVNIDDVEKSLIDMGYNVKMYESCYSVDRGYLSGKDELRAKDLQDAFEDKNIDAVFCIRGGYGAARLLDLIDFDVIKNNPKIFLGLSDITALHIAFNQKCDLVTYHGPVGRRFVDMELCQLSRVYMHNLANYNKIVNQRNKLLKDMYVQPGLKGTLDIWDMQMVEYGRRIIEKRKRFVEELNEIIQNIHFNLTGGTENLRVIYEPSCPGQELEKTVSENRERDMRMKITSAGPHRDDLCMEVNGIDIRRYGSQGQQRTAALSLKLSEIYIVKRTIKDTPVLLLDDVLSELDSSRQTYLLDSIHDIQTMITCTGLDDFISHRFHINKIFQVVNGSICE